MSSTLSKSLESYCFDKKYSQTSFLEIIHLELDDIFSWI